MNHELLQPESDAPVWVRAVALVTATPDIEEALTALLEQAVAAGGATAGAIVEGEGEHCRAAQNLTAEDLNPLIGPEGGLAAAHARQLPWAMQPFWLSEPGAPKEIADGTTGRFLIAPLQARGLPVGDLLLFYRGDAVPTAFQATSVTGLGGLVALVLENDRLYEDSRRARQARDHFLTALNHELRTPATALMLHAGMLQSGLIGDLPPKLQNVVQSLEADVSDLVAVIGRVLDLGQLEAGIAPAHGDLVNPRDLILDVLRRVEPSADRKGLRLSVFLPRVLPVMQTDAERFARILLHLLANAVKYTDAGRIEVRVERSVGAAGTRKREQLLVIRVTDTGRGIPLEEIERMFEPFAQVEEGARTDSHRRGIGLGLPLARKLARSLGGEVLVESPVGRGTVATLQLPYGSPGAG